MDTLRGTFGSGDTGDRHEIDETPDYGDIGHEEQNVRQLPPEAIGQDERRMQVRAYNHWASLLGERTYPSIEDLEPTDLPDFGPFSVLLDFSAGIEDPIVQYLGDTLAEECGAPMPIERLSDVPPRSLLSRITDHYMQIMANEAPIGFEAEFVNQRGASILYRGILLPFSSDDETIDFIYGVINWKEMADAATADELLLEIDQALEAEEELEAEDDLASAPQPRHDEPIADWADSPAHEEGEEADPALVTPSADMLDDNISDFAAEHEGAEGSDDLDLPMPDFGQYTLDDPDEEEEEAEGAGYSFASLADYIEAPAKKAVDLDADQFDPADYRVEEPSEPKPQVPAAYEPDAAEPHAYDVEADGDAPYQTSEEEAVSAPVASFEPASEPAPVAMFEQAGVEAEETPDEIEALPLDADLHDCLASARELALNARASEDRSRHALYAAVGRAYDFSLAAKDAPADYDTLIEESGLTVQDRAPMTPVVKLVFGVDYDKTRLTEYAAVLNHAHRLELERGSLANFLAEADGGLKGVVNKERRLRREESGKEVEPENVIREALAQKLRELEAMILEAEGPEFSLVMVRRGGEDGPEVIGEFSDDVAMIERAARKLVG